MCWLVKALFLSVLVLLCGVGDGQRSNITLSLFEISPCGAPFVQTVSRFESDIYVIQPDLSNCSNTSTTGNDSVKIGLRVVSWANVSTGNVQDPVVFIGRQGNSGVVSWNIPLQPSGFSTYFHHVNRTMCPSNLTSQDGMGQFLVEGLDSFMEDGESLFYVDVFSSSEEPVQYTIAVETVLQFVIELDKPIDTVVGASSPQIHYFKFPEDVSVVTVMVSTESDRCAFVSVQNNTCPINDLLENACSRGIYQTMSKSAYLTVGEKQVRNREFVLIIITTNYSNCHGSEYTNMEDIFPPNSSVSDDVIFAQNITMVISKLEPTSKFILAIFFPFLVFIFYMTLVCVYAFGMPRIYFSFPGCCKCRVRTVFPCTKQYYASLLSRGSVQTYNTLTSGTDSVSDSPSNDSGSSSGATEATPIDESIRSIREPDEDKLMLPLMYKSKYKKLDKQYSIYSWNTVTVGIFYALPAFQLVLSEQQILNSSGNQDKCYFNFKCLHPLGVLSAFNNVWSNVGYFLLGFLFLVIVSMRKRVYLKRRANDKEYVDSHGIPQFYGIYQAMGIALILEGFMSAFYHICPTDANFQFDTAFMFIIGGLFLVKLFQNRHPDINANAFIAFFSFAVIIFMTLIGIYLDRWIPIAIRCTIFIFVIILVAIFFFSFYRFHSWNWETLKKEFLACKKFFTKGPQHKIRFSKLVIVFLLNLALVLFVIIGYTEIDIATAILAFFVVNLMLFLLAYILQKLCYRETITALPVALVVVVIALWAAAFYFFLLKASTNWKLTPAESRAKNTPCYLFGFYGYHDVWHFFSASALFFSFLFLLSLDDGLKDTKREDIHIF